jgi:excisionase family DNA binding protein
VDAFLTVAEVAETLKLNQQTVRNWIDRGELPAARLGQRRIRVRESDLQAFIDAGSRTAEPQPIAPDTAVNQAPAWKRFRETLSDADAAVTKGDQRSLVEAIQALATAAHDLAVVLTTTSAS